MWLLKQLIKVKLKEYLLLFNKMQIEVIIMNKINHKNILKFYNWYESRSHLWIVEEYCIGGDLYSTLKDDGKLPIPTIKVFIILI